ncbi:hypothetical protein JKP22_19940 [Vibrio vulnificus]|uniref:hypothetical protein n=1 Tax=Vibrio vulnificus TaxID=672 RepID=UPI000CD03DC4|nr:hypothetical protein [Vibrio vulnificus]EGQ7990720.1 hypothetical protein [Vibrio vulnificus]EGR0088926.1 hypothetical protein [Vibrio vulnificus]EGR0105755.1 hypothetical protein [Vibrio vulnificus]EGR7944878.1 hypothetical protein [Vibrio vulnificus]EHU9455366.1 hypothetical protein [Vibrio vulnificus]
MESLELFFLNQSIEQIQKRFKQSGLEEQRTILQNLEAISKKLSLPEVHRSQLKVLADIRDAMECERARVFFSHSFVSWYRSGNAKCLPQLHHWSYLDFCNRSLFLEMLTLRDLGHFDDEGLYQFEQYCLESMGGKS